MRKLASTFGDLDTGNALLRKLCRRDDKKPLPGAQILRIHHKDVVELLRGKARILVAAGKIRADVDLHDLVVFLCVAREHLRILELADRRRAAKLPAAVHMGENVRGRDIHAVVKLFSVLDDAQRRDGNVVTLKKLGRQIARAVRNDLHSHRRGPSCIVRPHGPRRTLSFLAARRFAYTIRQYYLNGVR